jgi:hypothetical protein
MKHEIQSLLLQALEHERGGVLVYQTALQCVQNSELEEEWQKYLAETKEHVDRLTQVVKEAGLQTEERDVGREIVRDLGLALVAAMKKALAKGNPAEAELVACECVVLAETKDHLDWELLGKVIEDFESPARETLEQAHEEVEEQEDEHLYHSKGWCRELWLQALGKPAVLPPPEEQKDVKTAIGAARAEKSRDAMLEEEGS